MARVLDRADAREDAFEVAFLRPELRVEIGEAREVAERDAAFGARARAAVRSPSSRSSTYCSQPMPLPYSPSLTMSTPAATCSATTLFTALRSAGRYSPSLTLAVHAPAQQRGEVVGPHEAADVSREDSVLASHVCPRSARGRAFWSGAAQVLAQAFFCRSVRRSSSSFFSSDRLPISCFSCWFSARAA